MFPFQKELKPSLVIFWKGKILVVLYGTKDISNIIHNLIHLLYITRRYHSSIQLRKYPLCRLLFPIHNRLYIIYKIQKIYNTIRHIIKGYIILTFYYHLKVLDNL